MILGWGRSPGEGKSYPLQYSGLENSVDCIVLGMAKSDMTERLSLSYSYKGINDVTAKIKVLKGSDNTLATKKLHFSLS